jgi:hypothetical protein
MGACADLVSLDFVLDLFAYNDIRRWAQISSNQRNKKVGTQAWT